MYIYINIYICTHVYLKLRNILYTCVCEGERKIEIV